MTELKGLGVRKVMGGRVRVTGRGELQERGAAVQQVEPLDEIKKKSFSQSAQAVVQSSDLICFQEQFCLLLSCCASNREAAMGNINPYNATCTCI